MKLKICYVYHVKATQMAGKKELPAPEQRSIKVTQTNGIVQRLEEETDIKYFHWPTYHV